MNPRVLLDWLQKAAREKPLRYLGRRVVQAMVENCSTNLVLGKRSTHAHYLVVRLTESPIEREEWERQFAESRAAILAEVARDSAARELHPRGNLEVELQVFTPEDRFNAERALAVVAEPEDIPRWMARLREEGEVILPRRTRTVTIESNPTEAQVYLNDRPQGVTPCRLDDLPDGDHRLLVVRPGFLPEDRTLTLLPGGSRRLIEEITLRPEPPMGSVEIRTFPPEAKVRLRDELSGTFEEMQLSPSRWRLPAGPATFRLEMPDFAPREVTVQVPVGSEHEPAAFSFRLEYNGNDKDEVVGRLVIYRPRPVEVAPTGNAIRDFFQEVDREEVRPEANDHGGWWSGGEEILGERPLRRGILLIGREDPRADLSPDVRLFDPENTVARGCHAWLWIYADRSTGASYNTFVLGCESAAGVQLDGAHLHGTRRLSDRAEIQIGCFHFRLEKSVPAPRVEFGF